MSESESATGRRRRIGAEAKTRFLDALRAGLKRDDAAAQAGFTANGFYYARKGDPLFARAWTWAADLSAADQRAAYNAANPAASPDAHIAANRNRQLQRRIIRRPRFDERRKRLFLDHFAGTADAHAAAAAAGIGYPTVNVHRREDLAFAAAWDEALAFAYALLEAEAVRQRLEGQQRLRDGRCPTGEIAHEFDRVMQLLNRYDRRDGRIGLREVGDGRHKRWSFDDAIEALDKKLRALGLRNGWRPGDEAGATPGRGAACPSPSPASACGQSEAPCKC
jgi:hypothetical protein